MNIETARKLARQISTSYDLIVFILRDNRKYRLVVGECTDQDEIIACFFAGEQTL